MHIRTETHADFDVIDEIVAAAFKRPNEAKLVRLLRESEYYVADLAFVADEEGEIVGHIMLSYTELEGSPVPRILSLAPLAVRPDRQNGRIGDALTRFALNASDERGEPLVIVLGHANYYPRFGFEPARPLGIEPPDPGIPDEVFMVVRLGAYDSSIRGRVVYPAAFDATA